MSTTYGVFMRNGVNFSHDTAESISYSKTIASVAVSNVQDALDQVVDSYALNTTATTASAGLMPALGTSTTKYLRNDGTWNVPNNTTYAVMTSGTTGLVPSGGTSDKYLKGNATWDIPENTTYDVFTSVVKGLAPTGGTSTKYLRGDATWQTTAAFNTTYGTVTTATDGLMLSSDKAKLDNYPDKGSDTTKFLRNDGQWAVPPDTTYANVSTAAAGLAPKVTNTANFLKGDGTWATPTDTTYAVMTSGTTGLVPSGGTSDKFLRGDASWEVPTDTTYAVMTSGTTGLVPSGGSNAKYLRGDATWQTTAAFNTTYGAVTTAANGLMTSADKTKLDNYPDKGSDTTKYLRNDGQWAVPPNDDTTYAVFTTDTAGLVPDGGTSTKFLRGDATWQLPNNTTYAVMTSGTTGLVPSGGTNVKYLRGDATWQTTAAINTTYGVMTSGTTGLVPSGGTNDKYLRGDATWETPPNDNTTYAIMTSGTTGLVPSGGSNAKYLRGDATWQTTAAFNTTYGVMTSGTSGLVPASGTSDKYLRGDATWQTTAAINTTYGTATTAANGLMSSADKTTINSLKSAAFKDVTNTYSASGTDPVSGQAVAEALSLLPEPMKFKGTVGTGGTVTALPVDGSAAVGDTYKVITDGTYAGQEARVGDTFICEAKTSSANTWTYIPSGDEPGGTVTNVTIKATSPIVVDTTAAITTAGTRTISHANSGATAGNYGDSSAQTPGYGGTFKVPYVSVNATGHVTGISEHTVTIPASDNTDVAVTQTATTTNADYEVLFSESANNTTNTEGARKNSNLKFNPSSGNLQTTQINGVTVGNTPKFTDTTYANVSTAAAGLAPKVTNTSNFLKGDGTWAVPTDTTYSVATTASNGLMSATDKIALDAVPETYLPLSGGTLTGRLTTTKPINDYISGTGTVAQDKGSGVSPRYFPAKWTFDTGHTPMDGDIIFIKVPVAGHDFGVFISIDNGETYNPASIATNGRLTTHFPVGDIIALVYDEAAQTSSVFPVNGGDSRVSPTGSWRSINYYDSGNDTGYYIRRAYHGFKAGSNKVFPYTLIMQIGDGRWESLVTSSSTGTGKARNQHGFRLGHLLLMYANATYNENANIGNATIWDSYDGYSLVDHRYSFNTANNSTSGTTAGQPIYLVGTIGNDGLFYLDTTWWTQTLPSTEDGKVYILVGVAYNYYQMDFPIIHPMYKYTNGALRLYTQDAETVNGHTVGIDVPSSALFTDTTYAVMTSGTTGLVPSGGSNAKYLRGDATWQTTAAFNTTYGTVSTAVNGLAPKVTNTANFLKGDGTWAVPTDTTYAVMTSGTTGLVPSGGSNAKYLRGDATWQTTAAFNTTYGAVTTAANGLMTSADKTKLDNYPDKGSDTTKYLRNDGQWAVPPDTTYGVFTTAANGLTPSGGTSVKYLRGDATWQTTAAFNTTYGTVTTASNGLMTSTDKIKLNSYPDQGTDTTKYLRNDGQWAVPPDNNTTYAVMTSGTTGLVPSGGSNAKYLRGDATWQTTAAFNTTYGVMTSGTTGLVPTGGTSAKYLRGDATWQTTAVFNTTYGNVSTAAAGLAPQVTNTSNFLKGDGTWAVPTNTKNTAGSTDTSSKIFLIGATSQAANPQTYSDDEVFVTDGVLTTKKVQIGGTSAATIQYNATNQCIEFVFA